MWLKLIEYKVNVYSIILEGTIWFSVAFFLLSIFSDILTDIVDWQIYDYFVFFMLADFIGVFGRFVAEKRLVYNLLTGKINFYLNKPMKPFFLYYFSDFNTGIFSGLLMSFIINLVLHIFYWGEYNFTFLFFFLIFLLILMEIFFIMFMDSFSFYAKSLNLNKVLEPLKYGLLLRLPYDFLKNFRFSNLFFLFSFYFVGALLIPILKNQEASYIILYILLICSFIILFLTGTIINWKLGLRRYEAFG